MHVQLDSDELHVVDNDDVYGVELVDMHVQTVSLPLCDLIIIDVS